jgi:putative flavoprotein involved in K+ transport
VADDMYDAVGIGAGQAGLATSYYLDRAGFSYIVLEQGELVAPSRNQRWDSFSLVTPNYSTKLPGYEYSGDDPD